MLPRFLLVLWVPLVVVACLVFVSERADAEEALASWYGPGFSGLPTASGEPYDPYGFTAAHKTIPLGTELLVSYGGSSVAVKVNDRGPYAGGRDLDLSQGAAEALGLTEVGVDYVEYSSTNQYAAPTPDASSAQYAPDPAYPSTYQESYDNVSTTQYSSGTETVGGDGYAGGEQYQQAQPSTDVAAASEEEPVDGGTVGSVLVVRPGETLSGIAARTGVPAEYLAAQNAVADPDFIYVGQVLYY